VGLDHRRRTRAAADAAPHRARREEGKRPLPLLYQEMEGKYVVIGSKGGAPMHPSWYVNLRANPEC
jgi:hypothetical protein